MHRVVVENDREVACGRTGGHHGLQRSTIKKLNTIIAAERGALDVKPVFICVWVALFGVDHERPDTLGQLAVRHQIDAVISDKSEAWLFTFAGQEPVM
uniref:Uncharacterized protein n=1 Tax=Sinorhizobium sp. M14 TaxID=430451 RepID=R4ILG3_9HYPH|nr:hypothetical protein [Sinorhizobium sp. M14]